MTPPRLRHAGPALWALAGFVLSASVLCALSGCRAAPTAPPKPAAGSLSAAKPTSAPPAVTSRPPDNAPARAVSEATPTERPDEAVALTVLHTNDNWGETNECN